MPYHALLWDDNWLLPQQYQFCFSSECANVCHNPLPVQSHAQDTSTSLHRWLKLCRNRSSENSAENKHMGAFPVHFYTLHGDCQTRIRERNTYIICVFSGVRWACCDCHATRYLATGRGNLSDGTHRLRSSQCRACHVLRSGNVHTAVSHDTDGSTRQYIDTFINWISSLNMTTVYMLLP